MLLFFKRNAVGHLASVMWRYAKGYHFWVVVYVILAALAVTVDLARPLVLGELMNVVQDFHQEDLVHKSFWILLAFIGLSILVWLLHGPSRALETRIAFIVKRSLQTSLFRKITKLPTRWHRANHSGEIIDQSAKASQALGEFSESGFEVIHILTQFIVATVMLAVVMPLAGVAICVSALVAMTIVVLFDRILIAQHEKLNKKFNVVAASIQDYLTNVSTVISLRLEDRVAVDIEQRIDKILPLWCKTSILNEFKWFCTSLVVNITRALVLFAYIVVMVRTDQAIEVGTMYALIQYLNRVGDSFFQFTWKYGDLVVKSTRLRAVEHIEETYDREKVTNVNTSVSSSWRNVDVTNLSFFHDKNLDEKGSGLYSVSFKLERGKSYALVGESGSGKSTLLSLLRGMHQADGAVVFSDGRLLSEGMAHLAGMSTLIPQEPEIFSDSMRFNVAVGVDATDSEVLKAIELARFDTVLAKLPLGLKTSIAEKGVSLSGGEKQRLALARGLFFAMQSGSELILMDEPTSSVDKRNEYLIYQSILNHFSDKCIVSAVHNLDLLDLFDEVLVFANGRLVKQGQPSDLEQEQSELSRIMLKSAS